MGAGFTKILTYLDIGPEAKEDKYKKKYSKIITAGSPPKKSDLNWKSLKLSSTDVEKTVLSLEEGIRFIHSARARKENVLVCILPDDPDTVVFATAYLMVLSGLPVEETDQAITNALKESDMKLEKKYQNALYALRERHSPKQLRDELFRDAGEYRISLLSEDVTKVYELAGLPKPSLSQVKLEVPFSSKTPEKRSDKSLPGLLDKSHKDANLTKSFVSAVNDTLSKKDDPKERESNREKPSAELLNVHVKDEHYRKTVDQPRDAEVAKPLPSQIKQNSTIEHKPKTLELVDYPTPVAPLRPTEVRGIKELPEAQSAYIDELLLRNQLPLILQGNDYAADVSFTGPTTDSSECIGNAVTELNSLQIIKPKGQEKVEYTINASSVNEKHSPALDMKGLLSPSKTLDLQNTKQPLVSESSLEALAVAKHQLDKEIEHKQQTGQRINNTETERRESVQTKRKINIVRMTAANNDTHLRAVNEYMVKKDMEGNQKPRRTVRIIRMPQKDVKR